MFRKIPPGKALVRSGLGGRRVFFSRACVIPICHRAELVNVSDQVCIVAFAGKDGLRCKDCIRADVRFACTVKVNATAEDVLRVSEHGLTNVQSLFHAVFSEALKTVARRYDFDELRSAQDQFCEEAIREVATDLHGYRIERIEVQALAETPLELLDPTNILDAEGIKKITDRNAKQTIAENERERARLKAEAASRRQQNL